MTSIPRSSHHVVFSGASGVLALALGGSLAACGSVPISPNTPSNQPWTNYVVGELQTVPTGATMVEWLGHTRILRGYKMVMPVRVSGIGQQPPSDPGLVWPARYTYHGPCAGGRYVITTPTFYEEHVGIIVAADGTIPCADSVLQLKGGRVGKDYSTPEVVAQRAFVPTPYLDGISADAIRWELIYSGRSADEVSLSYREYTGGLARPAFYQDLTYDLSTSNRVVFRSIELEIVEASNAGVKFRVLRDGEQSAAEPSNLAPRGGP
jgi:hypothetical protein